MTTPNRTRAQKKNEPATPREKANRGEQIDAEKDPRKNPKGRGNRNGQGRDTPRDQDDYSGMTRPPADS